MKTSTIERDGEQTIIVSGAHERMVHLGMYVRGVPDVVDYVLRPDVPGGKADPRETMRYRTGDDDAGEPFDALILVLEERPVYTVWEGDRSALAYFVAVALALETQGYDTWTGVPGERAILAARRTDAPHEQPPVARIPAHRRELVELGELMLRDEQETT